VTFYPILNVSAVGIMLICLRNNLFDAAPIKDLITRKESCMWMLNDNRPSVKGMLSMILLIPVIIVSLLVRNVEGYINFIGGFLGIFVSLIIPVTLVSAARDKEEDPNNFNRSYFKSKNWIYLSLAWILLCFENSLYQMVKNAFN